MQPIDVLKAKADKAQNQQVLADELGVSRQMVSYLLKGERAISEAVAEKLGFERVCKWRRAKSPQNGAKSV